MKTLQTAVTVLSAVLISGVAAAQGAPGVQCDRAPKKGGQNQMRQQRGPQSGRSGMQSQRGPQMGMRGGQSGGMRGGQSGGMRGGPGSQMGQRPSINPERLKAAGASDEQLEQLKKLQSEQQLKQVDLKADAEKAQIELRRLMQDPEASEKDVMKAVEATSETRTEMMKLGISARFKAREILGEEVGQKLRELGKQRSAKGGSGGGQRGGPEGQRPQGRPERGGAPKDADA